MSSVLITGANRGLGLEFARQYGADGWTVIATCRNPIGPGDLATIGGDIQVHGLDVTDHAQIERLAASLDGTAVDVLINNAGIYGPKTNDPADIDYAAWRRVIETNALSPLRVASAFVGHVAAGQSKTIANITSKMGSMTDNTSGGAYLYRSSKAALNSVMRSLAHDLAGRGIKVCVLHPGWVLTDMGGPNALIDAATSVSGMRAVIADLTPQRSGGFYNYDGSEIGW